MMMKEVFGIIQWMELFYKIKIKDPCLFKMQKKIKIIQKDKIEKDKNYNRLKKLLQIKDLKETLKEVDR